MSSGDPPHVLHWDCEKQGCFNRKKRLKFHLLSDCLPDRIAFTDIDAATEIGGNLLLLEWKDHAEIKRGQRILFERRPAVVLIVEGDAEEMAVTSMCTVWCGVVSAPEPADLERLRQEIRAWAKWAVNNPALQKRMTSFPFFHGELLCRN